MPHYENFVAPTEKYVGGNLINQLYLTKCKLFH